MNSFETDLCRAIWNRRFWLGVLVEVLILVSSGIDSELFCISVPVICTLPYTVGFLEDSQSGFLKSYLPRTSLTAYIYGKIGACAISGGLVEVLGVLLYAGWKQSGIEGWWYLQRGGSRLDIDYPGEGTQLSVCYGLLFLSGVLWSMVSATLCAWTRSRYIAYGSSFVIYYLLVILQERYFPKLYCLNPEEWFRYQHTWIFEQWGIVCMLGGICLILLFCYGQIVRKNRAKCSM